MELVCLLLLLLLRPPRARRCELRNDFFLRWWPWVEDGSSSWLLL